MKNIAWLTSFLLLLPTFSSTSPCDHADNFSLRCSSLTSIPSNLHGTSITSMEITHSVLDNLESDSFVEYPSLKVVHLNHNSIREINEEAFEVLYDLQHLDLSHNKISTINSETFVENFKLNSLSLKDNPLVLSKTPFLSSESISYLDLSQCNLTTLLSVNFDKLVKLEILILRHNMIEELPLDVFDKLKQLKYIYLHGNPLNCNKMQEFLSTKKSIIKDYEKLQCFLSNIEFSTIVKTEVTKEDFQSITEEDYDDVVDENTIIYDLEVYSDTEDYVLIEAKDIGSSPEMKEIQSELFQAHILGLTLAFLMCALIGLVLLVLRFVRQSQRKDKGLYSEMGNEDTSEYNFKLITKE